MTITFLGTSSGKTSLNRYHTSLLFSMEDYNLLVDAGDGISRAVMSSGINLKSLNGILLTHLHPDHFSGLPVLIVQMKMLHRNVSLDIFIHESLKTVVEEFLLRSYLLPDKMGFEIRYKIFKENEHFSVRDNFSFLARKNSHLNDLEKNKSNYPALSLFSASILFESRNKKIIYTSDIGSEDDILLFKEYIPDIFISEATHIPPTTIIEKMIEINPARIYLTHYSDEDIPAISEILASLPPEQLEKVILAKDGLNVEI